jgi:hypothetical protein
VLSPLSLLVYAPKVYQRKEEYEEKKTSTNEPSSFLLGERTKREHKPGTLVPVPPGKRVWGNEKRQSCIDNH